MRIELIIDRTYSPIEITNRENGTLGPLMEIGVLELDGGLPEYYAVEQSRITTTSGWLDVDVSGGGTWSTWAAGGCDYERRGLQVRIKSGELNGFPVGPRGKFSGVK